MPTLPTDPQEGQAGHARTLTDPVGTVTSHRVLALANNALFPTGQSVVVKVKAGIPSDSDYAETPTVGTLQVDSSTGQVYVRIGANLWTTPSTFVTRTGGGREALEVDNNSGTTQTCNLAAANVFNVMLTANCTFSFVGATPNTACSFILLLKQDSVGSRSVAWPSNIIWDTGAAPALSTAPDSEDDLEFLTINGGSTWRGYFIGKSMA